MSESPLDQGADEAFVVVPTDTSNCRRKKWLCFGIMCAAALLGGFADGCLRTQKPGLVDLAVAGVFTFSTLAWLSIDANQHGSQLSVKLRLTVVLLVPLGFLVYCMTRRRWKLLGGGLLAFIAFMVTCGLGELVATGIAQ